MKKRRTGRGVRRGLSVVLSAACVITSVPGWAQAAEPGENTLPGFITEYRNVYFVDCGDYDVTTVSKGDAFGEYSSVTDQIYGVDAKTGKSWGIVDAPVGGGEVQGGEGTQVSSGNGRPSLNRIVNAAVTNWTWPQEDDYAGISDGSPKEKSNRFTINQIEKGRDREIKYKFELEPGTYEVETYMVSPWGDVSKSVDIRANKGKTSEVQFAAQGTDIVEKPLTKTVTVEADGILTMDYFSDDNDRGRAVNVSYITIARAGTDGEKLNLDYHDLKLPEETSADLELPSKGTHGADIQWSSGDPSVIAADGKVTRPDGQDRAVTLTAELILGGQKAAKEFTVTVKAKERETSIETFDMSQVKVTEPYYVNSLQKDLDYLFSLDTDRLLAGFRENAAYAAGMNEAERLEFMKHAVRYEGWESMLLSGQDVGHYLSSMAMAYANAGTTEAQKATIREKIDYMVNSLAECQEKSKNSAACEEGFLFSGTIETTTQLERQFDSVEGKGGAQWVPWYNMHKVLSGLVDIYKWMGNETSLDIAVKLSDWIYNRVSRWENKNPLWVEFGGMNDALYDLYMILEEKGYPQEKLKKVAEAGFLFEHEKVYERVATDNWGAGNALKGLHANTQVPKFVGAAKRYIALGESEKKYLKYAEEFWDMVTERHTFITGGNSQYEHFQEDYKLNAIRHVEDCETCNTYNMLKLSRLLYQATGKMKYLDFYENTFINAIMSSQNPETGMFMYFQPMCTGYQKVYCDPYTDFWCCTGTGMENFTKLNDSIYYKNSAEDALEVAQYLSSELIWKEENVKLTMDSGIQTVESDTAAIRVEKLESGKALQFNLDLRVPDWAAGPMAVKVNGQTVEPQQLETGFLRIAINDAAEVEIRIPMEVKAYNLPDSANTYAFKYGPVVLSAKLGTEKQGVRFVGNHVGVPSESAVENDRIEIMNADSVEEYMADISGNLKKQGEKPEFVLTGTNKNYVFVPHYSQHKESYGIYWTYSIDTEARDGEAVRQDKLKERQNRVEIDAIQAGYGQYEEGLVDNGTSVGSAAEHTRYAKAGGFFQYEVKVEKDSDNYLLCTLRREDDGLPLYITAGGQQLFGREALDGAADYAKQVTLTDREFEEYYQILVKIPKSLINENVRVSEIRKESSGAGSNVVDVRFAGTSEKESARLYYYMYNQKPYASENRLTKLIVDGAEKDFESKTVEVVIPASQKEISMEMEMQDSRGYISVNGKVADETKPVKRSPSNYREDYVIRVYAEDFESFEEYRVNVRKVDDADVTDNFSDANYLERYDVIGSRWNGSVKDGSLEFSTEGGDKIVMKDVAMADGTYQMDIKLTRGGNAGFIFRASNFTESGDGLDGYYVGVEDGRLMIGWMNQSWNHIKTAEVPELKLGTSHTLKVSAFGPRIRVYLDGAAEPYIDITDDTYQEGGVGIRGFHAGGIIDNVKVTAAPEYESGFENGADEWDAVGDWKAENGAYQASREGYALIKSMDMAKMNFSAQMKLADENTKTALMIRASKGENGLNGYGLAADAKTGKLQIIKVTDGQAAVLSETDCTEIQTGKTGKFIIEAKGDVLKAYVGESREVALTAKDSDFAAGQAGVWNITGSSSIVKAVVSGELIDAEPSTEMGELEEALKQAEAAKEAAEKAKEEAEKARDEAKKKAEEAQKAQEAAEAARKKAEEMANASQAEKEAAEKAADEAQKKAQEAKEQAEAAEEAARLADTARNAAEEAARRAAAEKDALQQELNAAKEDLEKAKEETQKARDEAQKAKEDAAAAAKKAEEALAALNKLTNDGDHTPDPVPSDPVKAGDTWSDGKLKYRMTSAEAKTVTVTGAVKSPSSIVIPSAVKIKETSYKVTAIEKNAFKGSKKLKKAVVGRNVKAIGSKAFYKCGKLKIITVKSTKMSSVGKGAFKGIAKKAAVKVPKKKTAAYKKMLRKAGLPKTAKVK